MKRLLNLIVISVLLSCGEAQKGPGDTKDIQTIFNAYWEERMQLFPMEATANGDNRYNDRLTITIAENFRDSLKRFYSRQLNLIHSVDTSNLSGDEKISCALFAHEMEMSLEGLDYPTHLMPINQFWGLTLEFPQLGSGKGNQPFKTVKDYDDFLRRASVFPAWADTAIVNMRKGMKEGWVLPRALVLKILPQLEAMVVMDAKRSIFYDPVKEMPDTFSPEDKERLAGAYGELISKQISPAYKKLYDFFEKEYMPKARTTTGISSVENGNAYYEYCARTWTTTKLTPDSIYNIGAAEVARIEGEMNKVKEGVGFSGDLQSFFKYVASDKKFFPFRTPEEVIDSFWKIKRQEDPQLKRLFNNVPTTQFTIRQTEAFRAASASAEYNPGSEDGSRPGIFYVPIVDATKYNAVGMETLFLHEAIPGHHYQISLAQENDALPKFRKFLWYGAYGEGWALYSETLGKELGLFTNPYQYFGHLSDAMHRAIRLVVDVGMHTKGMSREEAIAYMSVHESVSEDEATREIERYMAIPGQALSYKIGQLSISALRTKYEAQLGGKFNIASFHDEVLKDGCVPLDVLQAKLERWAARQ